MAQKVRFTKMHGCGNDYIYINAMEYPIADPAAFAVRFSDRHKGIGSDGLVLIDRSPAAEAHFSMRIFNADGSEAMMCGNAARCIGKYVYERMREHLPASATTQEGADSPVINLLTPSGVKTLFLHIANGKVDSVTVDMGEPVLQNAAQFLSASSLPPGTFVSMGNPHYVIFTDSVDRAAHEGPVLEQHPAFPQRCNIEFAKITDPTPDPSPTREGSGCASIRTRVWERGSGITQACGTGACATAVAACLTGRAGRCSSIVMDGGQLNIYWSEDDNHVYMTGPASFVFDGEVTIPSS